MAASVRISDSARYADGEIGGDLSGATGIAGEIKRVLALDIKESRWARAELAQRLSGVSGRTVSVAQLDAYTAESKPHRFPADLVGAWVKITGSRRLLALLCGETDLCLATQTDQEFAELGRTRLKNEQLTQRLWEKI